MRKPSILVPYQGPDASGSTYDIFIYLRPESNGFKVESTLMRAIRDNKDYHDNIKMVYFANFPGDYIKSKKIIEHHYSFKIDFAMKGKQSFSTGMKQKFEAFFNTDFEKSEILEPFEALKKFSMKPEELFRLWVEEKDLLCLCGQTIKKYKNTFILNYDIPAILHKNNFKTDIAVMLFRVYFSWDNFIRMIEEVEEKLAGQGITNSKLPVNRVFHYTKSPFEQLLDGFEYITCLDKACIDKISFPAYLLGRGFTLKEMEETVKNPIASVKQPDGKIEEDIIYELTRGMNYSEAADYYSKLESGC